MIPLMVQPLQLQSPLMLMQQAEQIRALQIQNQQAEALRRQMEEEAHARERQRQQQSHGNAQTNPIFDDWLRAAAPRMGLYPDFERVVFAPDLAMTPDMIRLMTSSPLAADIAYYLGSHKIESLGISKMNLIEAARAIEMIEIRLKAGRLP